ncbi:PAS domain S-box-containing protein [Rhodoblastus sphagnicola]|uniref:sensor histidine kinase n=1 Tax=Rhodoblastus sphagnicola TaxID=333368 RepID=UPI00160C1D3F|nr:PAS domain-containing sensor histidine kinase [Rhodoblastus sphagnicola]MBB4198779.1 PAS domain S-box-containing protein [Rhodoblastus sphagnicola]
MKEPGWENAELARRAAEAQCRQGFEAFPAHVAVLDENGAIMLVNRAWTAFAAANGAGVRGLAVGANYLDVCRVASRDDRTAREALEGLEAVLAGARPRFEMEYPCDSPTERRWFLMNVDALDPKLPVGAIVSHQDISGRKQAELALGASERRYRAVFDGAAVGMAEIAGDGHWLRANAAMLRIAGRSAEDLLSKTMRDITHEDDIDADAAYLEILQAGGADCRTMEKRLIRPDGSLVWTETALSRLSGEDGSAVGFIAVVSDISERKRAEERQATLMRELAHRGKNLLAVVQSVAQRSLADDGRSLPEARAAFLGRLQALAATYGALTDEGFGGAQLDAVLNGALAAFAARAEVEGPNFVLTVKAAQTFGLIAHELATNAAKYGALTRAEGGVRVTWEIRETDAGARLVFDWRERGGPVCAPPGRTGFGATILSRIAAAEFDCLPELTYAPEGFHYRFEAACDRIGMVAPISPVRRALKSEIIRSFFDQWARLRGPHGELPQLAHFDWGKFAATGALTLASILPDGEPRFAAIGRVAACEPEDEDLARACRLCAERAEPRHDFSRVQPGDGDPLGVERLLLPFSAIGGKTTHVVGLCLDEARWRLSGLAKSG